MQYLDFSRKYSEHQDAINEQVATNEEADGQKVNHVVDEWSSTTNYAVLKKY